jgi:excisionase family DNA binding protein
MRQTGGRFLTEFGLWVDAPAGHKILPTVPLERTGGGPMASEPLSPAEHPLPGGAPLLTAAEVGALLGVPASWVYEQSRLGRIPTVTLGRYKRYRRTAIEAWLTELEAPARRAAG